MTCSGNCDQGRRCDCKKDASVDRCTVIVVTLLLLAIFSMCYGFYNLLSGNKGSECAVTLQFNNNVKATYIGKTV